MSPLDILECELEETPGLSWILVYDNCGCCGPCSFDAVKLLMDARVWAMGWDALQPRPSSDRDAKLRSIIREVATAYGAAGRKFACMWKWDDEVTASLETNSRWTADDAYDHVVNCGVEMLRETLLE